MLDKLNNTLEEEKRALLTQMNKLLEKNQELLVKTLETKDVAIEDERIFNDRLGELERDKVRLKELLDSQRRDTLSKERDYWKKSNKSKNILKKGLKKLKGKIQVCILFLEFSCMCAMLQEIVNNEMLGLWNDLWLFSPFFFNFFIFKQRQSYTFEYPEGGSGHGMGGSSHTLGAMGSMGSIGSSNSGGNYAFHAHEGSMSSSQSVSSSNSKQSEEPEDEAAEPVTAPPGDR